jgi:hypothetical protein
MDNGYDPVTLRNTVKYQHELDQIQAKERALAPPKPKPALVLTALLSKYGRHNG